MNGETANWEFLLILNNFSNAFLSKLWSDKEKKGLRLKLIEILCSFHCTSSTKICSSTLYFLAVFPFEPSKFSKSSAPLCMGRRREIVLSSCTNTECIWASEIQRIYTDNSISIDCDPDNDDIRPTEACLRSKVVERTHHNNHQSTILVVKRSFDKYTM